jgi:DNA replication factor GINS
MMSLEVLSNQLALERETNNLKELPDNFKDDAGQYIKRLQAEGSNTYNYNEQSMLMDEEKNARILLEGILDRRFGKLMNISLIHSSGIKNIDIGTLAGPEREAFDILVKAINDAKRLL